MQKAILIMKVLIALMFGKSEYAILINTDRWSHRYNW